MDIQEQKLQQRTKLNINTIIIKFKVIIRDKKYEFTIRKIHQNIYFLKR